MQDMRLLKSMKADKTKVTRLLKTTRGQIDGILKMVEDDRYCIDIVHQLMATESILRKVKSEILKSHLEHCVKEAFESGDSEEKVNEIIALMERLTK